VAHEIRNPLTASGWLSYNKNSRGTRRRRRRSHRNEITGGVLSGNSAFARPPADTWNRVADRLSRSATLGGTVAGAGIGLLHENLASPGVRRSAQIKQVLIIWFKNPLKDWEEWHDYITRPRWIHT